MPAPSLWNWRLDKRRVVVQEDEEEEEHLHTMKNESNLLCRYFQTAKERKKAGGMTSLETLLKELTTRLDRLDLQVSCNETRIKQLETTLARLEEYLDKDVSGQCSHASCNCCAVQRCRWEDLSVRDGVVVYGPECRKRLCAKHTYWATLGSSSRSRPMCRHHYDEETQCSCIIL
jgi:hypothetical protein